MAVLNRVDFFNRINDMVGTDTSEQSLAFIEDMSDTYNDMESRANGDGENWEQKYHDLDESWKKKYRNRFFSTGGRSNMPADDEPADSGRKNPATIQIGDLFTPTK